MTLSLHLIPCATSAFLTFSICLKSSLYEIIRQRKGIEFNNSVKRLEVIFANYQEARYLGLSVGYPLLKISSVVTDSTGSFRYISIQRCVADKFEIVI